ncbi:MAG: hypothetical protein C0432_04890 [Candidatus Puniceispirillum sp.]|nr:hypothetical protein [Candidatus Pelagibacter sp.]MBA4283610.1 hypothetical protein [Candidatus Puniceispirillum sp.]
MNNIKNKNKNKINFMFDIMLYSLIVIAVFCFDIYLPHLPYLTEYFQTDRLIMNLSVSVSPFISAIIGLFYGRFSDKHGRKITVVCALSFLVVGSIVCSLSDNIELFLLGRIIQSFGTGGIINTCFVIMADVLSGICYAKALATASILFPVSFAIAPNFGAFLEKYFGWQSNFIFVGILSFMALLLYVFHFKETMVHADKKTDKDDSIWFILKSFLKDKVFLMRSIVHTLPLSMPIMFSITNAYLFIKEFGMSASEYAGYQTIPVAVSIVSTFVYRKVISTISFEKSYIIGCIGNAIFFCALIVSIFSRFQNYIVLTIIHCLLYISSVFLYSSSATQMFDSMKEHKGVGVSILALIRNLCLTAAILLAAFIYNKTAYPLYIASLILSLLLFYFSTRLIFFNNGEK